MAYTIQNIPDYFFFLSFPLKYIKQITTKKNFSHISIKKKK